MLDVAPEPRSWQQEEPEPAAHVPAPAVRVDHTIEMDEQGRVTGDSWSARIRAPRGVYDLPFMSVRSLS